MKKRPHRWRHVPANRDQFGTEGRRCADCKVHQYIYGTTSGVILFRLPQVPNKCEVKR